MKKWVIKGTYSGKADILSGLLHNRGIGHAEKEQFLTPPPTSYYLKNLSPRFKASLKRAQEEIIKAIKQNSPIIIHGDYDADGICATAILYKTITETLGYKKVLYFIPNRFDQGYGLSLDSVKEMDRLVRDSYNGQGGLIVTVDCGITAEPQVITSTHDLGFKLIITDHHQKKESVPEVEVVLWNDSMVGAGIALVLSIILGLKDEQLLSLAGIATVADLAPLKGFNRALVKKSLAILNSSPLLGIKNLLAASGRAIGEISVYDLGYIIGPRLNAAGRLDSAYDSLRLLLENHEDEIGKIAQKLNAVNIERQEMTQQMFELAGKLIISNSDKVIVAASSEFHEGVIGLVAGKLAQKYYKPAIVISINGDMAKGSARSVAGINIIELLRHFEDLFTGLGGHPMAAGFSLKKENLEQFTADFIKYAQETISSDLLIPQLSIDVELPLSVVDADLLKKVDQLKPYGIGNPEPVFLSRDVGVAGSDFVGRDGAHLSLKLFDGQNTYKAILFDAKNLGVTGFDLGTKLDIVYTAAMKEFNGKTSLNLVIKDWDPGERLN
jgi:single-stranded-DNA-specific exonuclease